MPMSKITQTLVFVDPLFRPVRMFCRIELCQMLGVIFRENFNVDRTYVLFELKPRAVLYNKITKITLTLTLSLIRTINLKARKLK